jgi:hypothetical protein
MVGRQRKIKLFNRIFQEFLNEYRSVSGDNIPVTKIKSIDNVLQYNTDVGKVLEKFIGCDDSVIPKISLLNFIDPIATKINWEYLHNLYLITLDTQDPELVRKSKENIKAHKEMIVIKTPKAGKLLRTPASTVPDLAKFSDMAKTLETSNLNGVMNDIAGKVTEYLKDVDISKIDTAELITSLMSGSKQACGIDFTSIIDSATNDIHARIDNGELDIGDIKDSTQALLGQLPKFN